MSSTGDEARAVAAVRFRRATAQRTGGALGSKAMRRASEADGSDVGIAIEPPFIENLAPPEHDKQLRKDNDFTKRARE